MERFGLKRALQMDGSRRVQARGRRGGADQDQGGLGWAQAGSQRKKWRRRSTMPRKKMAGQYGTQEMDPGSALLQVASLRWWSSRWVGGGEHQQTKKRCSLE